MEFLADLIDVGILIVDFFGYIAEILFDDLWTLVQRSSLPQWILDLFVNTNVQTFLSSINFISVLFSFGVLLIILFKFLLPSALS